MDDYSDIFVALVASVALLFLEVAIMLFIWNIVFIPWFGLPSITYWQMFIIKVFINIAIPSHSSSKE